MAISHCYWQLVVKNSNWQICQEICQQIYPQIHHGIYIMGCIWQPFCILQEKVEISFYFWIIRVVHSQLALYSGFRCNPPWQPKTLPKHAQNTPETPSNDKKRFQLWQVIFTLNTSTHNLADEPTLADGTPKCWIKISYCYFHRVVKNVYITLLLTSSGQQWQFHIATNI